MAPAPAVTPAPPPAPTLPPVSPTVAVQAHAEAPLPVPAAATAVPRWPFSDIAAAAAPTAAFDAAMMMTRNYYVVLDASGSMGQIRCSGGESKMAVALRALRGFVERLPADANLGLTVFDHGGIRELMPLRPLDKPAAAQAISSVRVGGGTPLATSIGKAYAALTAQGRAQSGYGEFHLVVVTDGEATGESPTRTVNTLLRDSPVVLHTIGFCIGSDHSLNQPGRVIYRAADNPGELSAGLAEVLAESPSFTVRSFK